MSTVLGERSLAEAGRGRWRPWLAILAGLLALYVPTYLVLARTLWREEEYAHGPIILAVFAWLAWRGRGALLDAGGRRAVGAGLVALAAGLALYVVGRSQSLPLFEVASHIPVVAGVLLLMGGTALVRRFAFALFFLAFLVPLPGFVLEAATGPLKELVSTMVAAILQLAGYPVVREGVVLGLGAHQMLVADACSGMNSLVSLFALALLYLHLTGPSTKARIAIVLASIVPIAILANIARVIALVLVTYYFGDEAGQGAFHTIAGLLVFITAFAMLMGVDRVVPREARIRSGDRSPGLDSRPPPTTSRGKLRGNDGPSFRAAAIAALLMIGAAVAAPQMKPVPAEGPALDLESLVPQAFGDWSIDPSIVPVPPSADVQAKLDRIYGSTLSRAYVNSRGEQMMLTIAYGGDQSDALKAHRQEVCYTAQGFTVRSLHAADVGAAGRIIPATRMLAVRGDRSEPVTYWFTMGDRVVRSRLERLEVQLASGFGGRVPDGMLVRVSSISRDPAAAFAAQQAFVAALLAAVPPADAARIAGAAGP
ncbi:MAG: exosortase B [Usitatibacter sp.]